MLLTHNPLWQAVRMFCGPRAAFRWAATFVAIRRDRRLAFAVASTATLPVTDAWFDVCTAPAGRPLMVSLAGMCVEIGEAAACILLAVAIWRDERDGGSR
jgi:hypothetical protein